MDAGGHSVRARGTVAKSQEEPARLRALFDRFLRDAPGGGARAASERVAATRRRAPRPRGAARGRSDRRLPRVDARCRPGPPRDRRLGAAARLGVIGVDVSASGARLASRLRGAPRERRAVLDRRADQPVRAPPAARLEPRADRAHGDAAPSRALAELDARFRPVRSDLAAVHRSGRS